MINQLPKIIKENKGDTSSSLIDLIKTFIQEYIKNTIPKVDAKDASIYGRYMMEDGGEGPWAVKMLIDKVPDSETDKQTAANKIVRDYIKGNNITKKDGGPDVSDIVGVADDGTFLAVILNIDYDSPTDDLTTITQRCTQSLGAEISSTPTSSTTLPEQPYYPLKNPQDTNKIKDAPPSLRCTLDRQLIDITSSNEIKYVNTDAILENAKVPLAYGNVPWNTFVGSKAIWDVDDKGTGVPITGRDGSLLKTSFGPACIPVWSDGIAARTDFWAADINDKNSYMFNSKEECEDKNKCYGIYMRGSDGTCNVSPCTNNAQLPVVNTTDSHPYTTMPLHGNQTTIPPDDPLLWIQGKDACYRKVPDDKIMDEKCEWANSSPFSSETKCAPHKGTRTPNGTQAVALRFSANCKHEGSWANPSCHGYAYDDLIQTWNDDGLDTPADAPSYHWCMAPTGSHQKCTWNPLSSSMDCNNVDSNDWRWVASQDGQTIGGRTISTSYDSGTGERGGAKPEYGCKYYGIR